jgi:hypothetical protein
VLHAEGFKGLLIFLVAAGIIVPLFHRARIGTVLGFLLVGVALGPYGLGRLSADYPWLWYLTFDDPDRAMRLVSSCRCSGCGSCGDMSWAWVPSRSLLRPWRLAFWCTSRAGSLR